MAAVLAIFFLMGSACGNGRGSAQKPAQGASINPSATGGTSSPKAVASSSTRAGVRSEDATSASSSDAPDGGATGSTSGGNGSPPRTSDPEAPSTTRGKANASLDRPCVHRGSTTELQGLTVDPHRVGFFVGYSTLYSDGSDELKNPSYKTGFGYGPTGPDGTYHTTWVVPVNAPNGVARVRVIVEHFDAVPQQPDFLVVDETGTCP